MGGSGLPPSHAQQPRLLAPGGSSLQLAEASTLPRRIQVIRRSFLSSFSYTLMMAVQLKLGAISGPREYIHMVKREVVCIWL